MVIDGKKIASEIIERLKKKSASRRTTMGFLAAFLVGRDSRSLSFLKQKERTAKELGVDFRIREFPESISQDDLEKEISKIAEHKTCGGVIVQLPLPENLNKQNVLNVIPPEKDVDVLGERALNAFYAGKSPVLPPSAGVVEEILKAEKADLKTKKVAVIGRGSLVGQPVALWFQNKAAELVVYPARTEDLEKKLGTFDLIVSGAGRAHCFKATDLKPTAMVIDFGYDFRNGRILGDFDPAGTPDSIRYTPTPGGTGPILVAKLFENFFKLATL